MKSFKMTLQAQKVMVESERDKMEKRD